MLNQNFAHLHVHNEYSLLDGLGKAEEYVARAKELGFYYLALTNHGNIDGLISFQKACRKQKITPVFGCELYICSGKASSKEGRHNYHITTLIRNQAGWNTLCRMLSFANLEGFYYRPRIGIEDLLEFDLSGLIIMTGCANSVLMCEGGIELIQAIQEQYENVFLEIMPHQTPEQREHYQVIKPLIKTFPVVATNDCHYVMEGDSLPQEVLLAVQRSAKWSDPKRFKFDIKGLHLRSAEEMVDAFQEQDFYPEETWRLALSNTVRVAKMCGPFQIRKRQINLPTVPKHEGKDPDLLLTKLCYDGLFSVRDRNLINEVELEEYKERMVTELDLIKGKGFSNYFLIVRELLDWCKETGIMYGPGRGSVGGSMVAYLLGITNIDPIKFNLLFDRFINKDRIDYPDIDLDFEDIYRERVRKHLEETYGENNVAGLSTFLEMKGRMVIRDVGRVFDLPSYEIDAFAKSLWSKDDNAKILGEARTGEGRALADEHPEEYAVAERLEQQIRGVGQHAAAVIVSRDDLTETNRGHLCKRNDHLVMNWDMGDAEYMGLMKLDILGLATLTVLNECSRLVGGIDFNSIPLDDGEVLASITADNLAGLFQLSGKATADLLNHIKIKSFNDIVIIITASRPGPADSGMTAEYIKRRGGGGIRKEHPLYQEATKETLGVVLFQEQMMAIMNKVAGLSYSTADNIRKVIGKKRDKKEFEPYRQGFISGCLRNKTMSGREASLFWEGLLEWARYGFPKAHAVGYAMLGYWTAYCKVRYPKEFICAALAYGKDKEGYKADLVKYAIKVGLTVSPPKVGKSDSIKWTAIDAVLYAPFIEIKGIGEKTALELSQRKEVQLGFFSRPEMEKLAATKGNTKTSALLSKVGAYGDDIPEGAQEYFSFPISVKDSKWKWLPLEGDRLRFPKGLITSKHYRDLHVLACTKCNLAKECSKPVLTSIGQTNTVILGEGPGKNEDAEGLPFVGDSGEVLWESLNRLGYKREFFHIMNVVRCWPSESKTPSQEQIGICFPWTAYELRQIDCKLILALGNTPLVALTDKPGITKKTGTTEWVERVGAWVCWCVHPSWVLRGNDQDIFDKGIDNFVKRLRFLRRNK
jgi:DNA polymerase-3 subunit alpha